MHWFLKNFILPLLDALRPAVIVEVGVELGAVTEPLLAWAERDEAVVHSIDPSPKLEVDELLARHPQRLRFHRAASLDVLPSIQAVDLALIDGDHNWYTVLGELRQLARRAADDGRRPPVILLHDIGWPYGRRDLYYNPEAIPEPHRQPHAQRGILPGQVELARNGVNSHLDNALLEGTPANGVLTAVEDFIAESDASWRFQSIPGLSGLGVLLTTETYSENEPLRALLDAIDSPTFLRRQCEAIEDARLRSEARRDGLARKLAQTQLQLRVTDPRELRELEGRAAELERQLRLVGELEEQLQASLQDGATGTLAAIEAMPNGPAELDRDNGDLPPAAPQPAATDNPSSSLLLHHRLQLALATSQQLQSQLDETRTTLTAQLESNRRETHEARRALEPLRARLAELELELELSGAQHERLRSALARTQADVTIVDGERQELERRLCKLRGAHAQPEAGEDRRAGGPQVEQELATARRERDEMTYALAQLQGRQPGVVAWAREIELRGQQAFLDVYLPLLGELDRPGDTHDPLSLPLPADRRGLLCAIDEPQEPQRPSVDVVVCVHDALEDVRRCLSSLLNVTERRFRLILVDDGSAEPTRAFLASLAARHPAITLTRRAKPPHGYTLAANVGLRASRSDYVVLLNSDTLPTPGWLARLVDHGERHPQIGILGPLSNAASHQSVPELRHAGAWAENPLPDWLTEDGMAVIVQRATPHIDARLPFVNGFCYMVKRGVIESIGHFDEERFAAGYCEENDYSYRAYKRGYHLGVATDAYVYHAKSRSFGSDGRKELASRHYEAFLEKHDREELQELVRGMEASTVLAPVRQAIARASSSPLQMAALLSGEGRRPLEIVFVLPGLADGGSGGSHSIYQEVKGMRELGIPARIALDSKAWERAQATYADASEVFEVYADVEQLAANTAGADVISATHFKSVALLRELYERRQDFLPAYYVQDYEPFFTAPDSADLQEALASYTALPDLVLFAKTNWLCNVVGLRHGLAVQRVQPSIDGDLFYPAKVPARETDGEQRLRVLAMVRPRTPRRQPAGTIAVLERLLADLPGQVEVSSFGCRHAELARLTGSRAILESHLGVLSRARVAERLRNCDVFLDMSTYQAFGRSALEAMACGCTAVVPEIGGAWEFVQDGVNALAVDTLDVEAVMQAIVSLASDRARLEEMRVAARGTAARFSIVRASLSEYLLFERLHRQRFGQPTAAREIVHGADGANRSSASQEEPATPLTTPTIAA
jgi:GT2 family glycosyltransferase/glycosyltransferase involved in cell wall biosynthesis